jgi:preprotein translocase subunit SecF
MIDWMKYRYLYFSISSIVIIAGLFGLFQWGLNLGVDFKGGTIAEYKFSKSISTESISGNINKDIIDVNSIQETGKNTYLFRLPPLSSDQRQKVKEILLGIDDKAEELRFETVGPSIGPELVKKTIFALLISAGGILFWVAYQFKSIKFGVSAVLAMFHDSLVLIGLFSLLGHFFGAEVDFLFVTALLTILSFSVHDTIVVYDRIRETQKKTGEDLVDITNHALTQTMVRSLNNSMTIVFMLIALVLLGGTTIKWFAVALLIGTVSGTYSSPFVAVPILITWDQLEKKYKK